MPEPQARILEYRYPLEPDRLSAALERVAAGSEVAILRTPTERGTLGPPRVVMLPYADFRRLTASRGPHAHPDPLPPAGS